MCQHYFSFLMSAYFRNMNPHFALCLSVYCQIIRYRWQHVDKYLWDHVVRVTVSIVLGVKWGNVSTMEQRCNPTVNVQKMEIM